MNKRKLPPTKATSSSSGKSRCRRCCGTLVAITKKNQPKRNKPKINKFSRLKKSYEKPKLQVKQKAVNIKNNIFFNMLRNDKR